MPVVPVYSNQERLRGIPQQRLEPARIGAGAQALARGAQSLARGGMGAAITLDRLEAEVDEAAAKQLDLEYLDFERVTLFGDEQTKGFLNTEAQEALNLRQATEDALRGKAQELVGRAQSARQRDMLEQVLSRRLNAAVTQTQRHYARQAETYRIKASEARATSAIQNAFRYRDDPERHDAEMATIRSEVEAVYGAYGPDVVAVRTLEAISTVHALIADDIARTDPLAARDYLDRNANEIAPQKLSQMRSALQPVLDQQEAEDIVNGLRGGVGLGEGGPVPEASLVRAVAMTESGNRDFRPDGKPVLSPKGAMYAMQVMPATAQNPGFGITPARADTPEEYNRVGVEYLRALRRRYGNDVLAIAAYNAGPGAVDGWLDAIGDPRKGVVSVGEWIARIPFEETRNYVRKVLRSAGVVGSRNVPRESEVGPLVERIQGLDLRPEVRRRAEAYARSMVYADREMFNEQQNALLDRVWQEVDEGRRPSPEMLAQLKRENRLAVERVLNGEERVAEGGDAYFAFLAEAEFEPQKFIARNPNEWRGLVTPGEAKTLFNRQAAIRNRDEREGDTMDARVDRIVSRVAKDSARQIGLQRPAKGTATANERYVRRLQMIEDVVRAELTDWMSRNGGQLPGDRDVRVIQDKALSRQFVFETEPGFFSRTPGQKTMTLRDLRPKDIDRIPAEARAQIEQAYRDRTGRDPSPAEVLLLWQEVNDAR